MNPLAYLAFAALGTSAVMALWGLRIWIVMLAAAILAGAGAHAIGAVGLLATAVTAIACLFFRQAVASKAAVWLQLLAGTAVVLCAFVLALHLIAGFHNIVVIDHAILKPGALPFSLYLNFDKTLAGALVLGWCWWRPRSGASPANAAVLTAAMIIVLAVVLMSLAMVSGYVRWEPLRTGVFPRFAAVNLIVCVSEEAFFRGFFQTQWNRLTHGRGAVIVGILLSGVLFGAAHLAGGLLYVGLAAVAGIGYAVIFHITRRLECSVLTHWSVNSLHFLLFTYPALADHAR